MQRNSKLNTANRAKSPWWGVGGGMVARAASGPFPPAGKQVQEQGKAFKGETESSLSILVFCAIKKPDKINIT